MFRRAPRQPLSETAPALHALRVQTSAYGTVVPLVFGTGRIPGFLLDYQDFKAIPHVTSTPTGGKGGPKSTTTKSISYTYQSAVDIGLCEGIIQGIYNVWDTKGKLKLTRVTEVFVVPGGGGTRVVANSGANFFDDHGVTRVDAYSVNATDYGDSPRTYAGNYNTRLTEVVSGPAAGQFSHNGTGTFTFAAADAGKTVNITYTFATPNSVTNGQPMTTYVFTLFKGWRDSTQTPWGYMTTAHPGHDLAYRGLAHVASPTMDLGSGGTLPNLTFEVTGLSVWNGGIIDCDPKDIITELITNQFYGLGQSAGFLDALTQYSNYCVANNLFLSAVLDEQRAVSDILDEILVATNAAPLWSEGKLKIIPYGDTTAVANGVVYAPQTTPVYDLNDDDFLAGEGEPPVRVDRNDVAEAFNQVALEWTNRDNDYNPEVIEDKDQGNIELVGLRKPAEDSVTKMHMITTKKAAQAAVNALLKRSVAIRNVYRFNLSWKYMLLEPMDLVTVTDSNLGLNKFPVRITSIEETEDGTLEIEAEEFPFGTANPTLYPKQDANPYSPQAMADPGNTTVAVCTPCPYRISGDPFTMLFGGFGGADWGGATIWVSVDDASYKPLARLTAPVKTGIIKTSNLAALAPGVWGSNEWVDTVNSLILDTSVSKSVWTSGTQADADNYRTLGIFQNGNFFSYKTATLSAADEYTLTYLRRGVLSTASGAQNIGQRVIRIDDAVLKVGLDPGLLGKRVYFKFTSFNTQGLQEQSLASVSSNFVDLDSRGVTPDPEGLNFLEHIATSDGGGNRFDYRGFIAGISYVVVAGDKLCYDVWLDHTAGYLDPFAASDQRAGIDMRFSDATVLRGLACNDQDSIGGASAINPGSKGQWYQRQIDLTAAVGKTLTHIASMIELDNAGRYRMLIKSVCVRNGNTVKVNILSASGAVDAGPFLVDNTTGGSSGMSDIVAQYQHKCSQLGSDPTNDAMPKLGSVPPTISGDFSFTTTTTSITISWASLVIYRIDQWFTGIPDGSVAVTGLTANTAYQFYPYYDESLKIVRFVIGTAGTSAFGAIAHTAKTAAAWQKQWAQHHVPLADGALSISTPASGTGGGSGGGHEGGHCPEATQFILENMLARDATIGVALDCIENWKQLVKRPVVREPIKSVAHCFELTAENGCSGVFSAETPITLPSGDIVKPSYARGVPIYSDQGWSHICKVLDAGIQDVVHLHLNGGIFAAGKAMGRRLYTHNTGIVK